MQDLDLKNTKKNTEMKNSYLLYILLFTPLFIYSQNIISGVAFIFSNFSKRDIL